MAQGALGHIVGQRQVRVVEHDAETAPLLRAAWPQVRIIIRGDSGFCREDMMARCEADGIDFVLGLAKKSRLNDKSLSRRVQAQQALLDTGEPSRVFGEFEGALSGFARRIASLPSVAQYEHLDADKTACGILRGRALTSALIR